VVAVFVYTPRPLVRLALTPSLSASLQAGKGRSGMMACNLMQRLGKARDAADAMAFYDQVCWALTILRSTSSPNNHDARACLARDACVCVCVNE